MFDTASAKMLGCSSTPYSFDRLMSRSTSWLPFASSIIRFMALMRKPPVPAQLS